MKKTCAIILAAGEGKRMKCATAKALCKVLEKPMIDWILDVCEKSNIKKKCVIIGNKAELIKNHVKSRACFAFQREQKGTADAIKSAINFLKENEEKDVFVCCSDSPLLDKKTILESFELHKKTSSFATIISTKILELKNLGTIVRNKENEIVKIVEKKDATEEELKINEVNSGAYWFKVKELINVLDKIESNNNQNEYYLTDAIHILIKNNKKVSCYISQKSEVVLGVNDKFELLKINEIAKERVIEKLIEDGVEFVSKEGVLISPDVIIEKNTKIFPGSIILGKTKIKEDATIGPNSLIKDSEIGEGCTINSSQVYNSTIEDFTTIGPFSHIRPNSKVSHHVKIGDFVEVKNSNIGAGTSISHLTYVGDSDVGKNVNFGCGVVTINYDGVNKNRCNISDGAFLGCNTNLVAPVKIGKNSYTGAGSTITKDVPDEALAIERTNQVNVKNFSKIKLKGRKLKIED